jgi:transcriptional regulator with XRE-family HTH domain
MESLHLKIKRLRKERKLTLREVAQGIGVPLTTYREWEYGRAIRSEHLINLAKFFGVSLEDLTNSEHIQDLSLEQRLKIAIDHLLIVHSEINLKK